MNELAAHGAITQRIAFLRGHKVLLDKDLAKLYGVETRTFLQTIKRHIDRFPEDFMFQLTKKEFDILTSQIVMSRWGGRRHLPYAFTEQGVAMLSSVLRSKRAIQANIAIMRAFVKLREIISTHKELSSKLEQLERKIEKHDKEIHTIFQAIRRLMTSPEKPQKRIGFNVNRKT
ncbi:ORF6N domain-containing protein [Candidatus Omnitrophota bacterium]